MKAWKLAMDKNIEYHVNHIRKEIGERWEKFSKTGVCSCIPCDDCPVQERCWHYNPHCKRRLSRREIMELLDKEVEK